MKTIVKKVPKKKLTVSKDQKIREEVYTILNEAADRRFLSLAGREETLQKRLDSIERAGVPEGTLEELKRDISGLRYIVNKQTHAIGALLSFFNLSKDFLTMEKDGKTGN